MGVVRVVRKVSHDGGVVHHVHFFKQDHSVPVRAPPTEAPDMELDESSGRQSSTEASEDTKGQDQSGLSVPEPFTVPLSSFNSLPELTMCFKDLKGDFW